MSFARVTSLLVTARAAAYALALLNSIVLARTLGIDRLGEYAYAMGLAALFALLPNMGIAPLIARRIARDPHDSRAIHAGRRAQGLMAAVVALLVPGFAALLPEQPVSLWCVALAGAQLAIGSLSWPYLAVLTGHARYDRLAAAELASALLSTAAVAAAAVSIGTVTAVLVAHLTSSLASVAIARAAALGLVGGHDPDGGRSVLSLLREGLPFGGVSLAHGLYSKIDVLLLGQLAPTGALGLYTVAYKPITLIIYFGSTIAGALFPLVARMTSGGLPFEFWATSRLLAWTGPAAALFLTGMAGPLLRTVYGGGFAQAEAVLVVLAWSAVFNLCYAPHAVALQAASRERLWFALLVAALVLNTALNLLAIPSWGAVGAAWATLGTEGLLLAAAGLAIGGRSVVLLTMGPPALAALAAGALLWWLRPAGPLVSTAAALALYGLFAGGIEACSRKPAVPAVNGCTGG